jgi:hypothetical protein
MLPPDPNQTEPGNPSQLGEQDAPNTSDPLLARVKEVARRIMERIRKVTEDTDLNHTSLPTDPTEETPPLTE